MSDVSDIDATLPKASTTGRRRGRTLSHLRPIWQINVKGQDISARLNPRLVSLTITDNRDGEADEVEIVISDHDGAVELPETGDPLTVAIGWAVSPSTGPFQAATQAETGDFPLGLIDKGSYSIQAVEYSGSPDTITLRARAANLLDELRTVKDRSWHKTTLGTIVRSIAAQNKLKVSIDKEIAGRKVTHADQAHESDASFLRRLGRQFDCLCNIKAGTLLFSQARKTRTPSGKELPTASIVRSDGDQHRWARSDRDAYSGVKAFYNNVKKGTRSSVIAGISGRAKTLRQTFASEADALAAARAEWLRIQRGIYSFDIALAYGRADLMPQRPVVVSGYKPQIDKTAWIITAVRHSLSSSGYTSQITLETLQAEGVDGGDEASED
ncbi:contractile injection system protein, VgrG/Pvc8 family [Comamonas antarctica]|uniref:Late control protein n=1 Tax=Comamonas antarctica TaxID=2743470 RepID=A0A6N1X3A1_9BURK|nr:contractile injection system protein, VgrG/Pvc8 family [Comamonas antarctica]QKV52376.1 late control protein [Comamonas antarctica]